VTSKSVSGSERLPPPLPLTSPRSVARYLLYVLVLAALYFGTARIGLALAFSTRQVTAIWPPTGIVLTALLLFGPRVWPGVFVGALAANLTSGEPLAIAVTIAFANTLCGLVGVWALRALHFDGALECSRDVLALIAVAVVSPLLSATAGITTLLLGGFVAPPTALSVWCVWWVGSSLGILMFTPLSLTWFYNPYFAWGRRGLEFVAYLLMLLAAGLIAFALPRTPYPASYVAFPILIWAGLRLGPRDTASGACLLSLFALWGALHGSGPFAEHSPDERLLALDVFIGVISCTALLVSAVTAERMDAQATARSSKGLLRAVFEHTPAIIYVKDRLGRFLMVNRRFEELFHVKPEEVIGKTRYDLWPKDTADRFHDMDQRVIEARRALTGTEDAPQDDGTHTYISVKCPLWNGGREPYAVMGISTDITDLHAAQEQLNLAHHELEMRVSERTMELASAVARLRDANAALERRNREKETLLKEIHHRVKNNLQVISSLLNLQAQGGDEPNIRAFVENNQSRVRSMALVHEHLYRSDDLQSVPMGAYLRAVVDGIKQAQGVGLKVHCEVRAEDIALPIERAIPCGLIVNEVVTNALKHAFPNDRSGRVDVSMSVTPDRLLDLEIRDNGVGIPSPSDERQQSFGLRLVGMLAGQLHGRIETEQESGLAFRLRFQVGV
jgi:PAS domain S-box-containing protein